MMSQKCWSDEGGRAWLEVTFECPPAKKGRKTRVTKRLIADMGCIFPIIVNERTLNQIGWEDRPSETSNYGWLTGALVRIVIPALGVDAELPGYANNRVARLIRTEGFDGIAGKPFLDLFHWSNGRGGEFCLESWTQFRARQAQ